MSNCNYMSKDDGPIEKVVLNEWVRKRAAGYIFRTEKEYQDQVAAKAEVPSDDADVAIIPTMDNTKAEILEYAQANGIEVDDSLKKADLLAIVNAED